MQAFIVSDSETAAHSLRPALLLAGVDCQSANVLAPEQVGTHLPSDATLVVLLFNHKAPEQTLTVLGLVRARVACPVLVVGPSDLSRLVLQMLRAGAADFVEERDVANELPAAIGRLRGGALSHLPEPARTIAILAPSGGSGSSTLAVNVATALAAKHQSALLMDLKLRNGDLASLLDLRPTHTLAELCQTGAYVDRTMFETSLAKHDNGVQLLGPPRWFSDAQFVTPEGVRQVLTLARATFPYVVMDVDSTFAPEQVEALRVADVIVLVMRLDFTCLRQTKRTMDYLEQLGLPRDKIRVVVNRFGQSKEVPADRAEEALGVKIADYIPEDAKTVNRANNNGVPVVQDSPSARVAKSLIALASGVNGRKHT